MSTPRLASAGAGPRVQNRFFGLGTQLLLHRTPLSTLDQQDGLPAHQLVQNNFPPFAFPFIAFVSNWGGGTIQVNKMKNFTVTLLLWEFDAQLLENLVPFTLSAFSEFLVIFCIFW